MEKYIITFEDGQHFLATEITKSDKDALKNGILTIIRLSDGKELGTNDNWGDLLKWEVCNGK